MEVDEGSDQNSDIYSHWIAAHACLKNEFTEEKKCHNMMSWLKYMFACSVAVYTKHHCEIDAFAVMKILLTQST